MAVEEAGEVVVVVAQTEEPRTRIKIKIRIEIEAPSIQIYPKAINNGAQCIINMGKIRTFVQILQCVHGRMSSSQGRKKIENLTSLVIRPN